METPNPLFNDLKIIYQDINDELTSIGFATIDLDFNFKKISDFASSFAKELKDRADQLINSENDSSSQEGNFITYIFFRYNECVLWDLSGNEERFQESLLKLNNGLTSRIIDDSCASEKLFLYVAELNFKVHNYSKARKFVEKSIKLESRQDDCADNVPLRFHKRCLEAFCCEYSFVPAIDDSRCLKSNSLIDAVICLVGRNPKDFVATEGCMAEEFKGIIKEFNKKKINAIDIISKIYDSNTDCLAKKFYNSYVRFLPKALHQEYIKKLAHILAHCFSEIHKWAALDYLKVNYESIYLFSMAEILMKSLGPKYITCYSTVLLENEQYMPAIEEMISVRKMHEQDWVAEDEICELAQIDFYIWYFSVIAKKFADTNVAHKLDSYIDTYKKNFAKYKNSHEEDFSARTYYELLSMKEELIRCFAELKSNDFFEASCSKLIESYKNFSPSSPKKNIHKDIQEEWNMLNFAYYIFLACYRYIHTQQDWYLFNIEERLLSQTIYDRLERPKSLLALKQYTCGRNYKQIETQKHIYCEITLPYGKFIYVGSNEALMEKMLDDLCVNYSVEVFSDDSETKSIKDSLLKISNVLFIYNESNKDYLDYLRYANNLEPGENKPNVFIYDGLLDIYSPNLHNQIVKNNNEIKQIISGNSTFRKIDNLKTVIRFCAMFSALESCISRIYKPLNTLVISPIETVEAYSDQSVEQAIFLRKSEVGTLKQAQGIADWNDGFKACFTKLDKKIKAKSMRLTRLCDADLCKIEVILLIEHPKNITINSKVVRIRTNVYTFDRFSKDLTISSCCASITTPYDQRSSSGIGDVVYNSVLNLYNSRKTGVEKVHGEKCTNKGYPCCSIFYDLLYKPGEKDDKCYSDFIDVLYRYNLLKRDTLDKASILERNYAITKTRSQDIVFCLFKAEDGINNCENFCKVMTTGIVDATDEDYIYVMEMDEAKGAWEEHIAKEVDNNQEVVSKDDVVDIAIGLVKIWIQKQTKTQNMVPVTSLWTVTDKQALSDSLSKPNNNQQLYERYSNAIIFLTRLMTTFESERIELGDIHQTALSDEIDRVFHLISRGEIILGGNNGG